MPVSKKRKKDGKPVHRSEPAHAGPEHAHGPETAAATAVERPAHGKPSNPFVAQQTRRASQRGR
ncbi:MAG: hypothetical protein QM767_01265 [Anaeromyxobacter sp.]